MHFSGLWCLEIDIISVGETLALEEVSDQWILIECRRLTHDMNVSGQWILARMYLGQHLRKRQ